MKNSKSHLVSVIVPVYNVEKYLVECVELLKAQTYSNIEIILIDDGSEDSSGILCDILAGTDKRIYVIHQSNQGLSAARNVGIEASHGEYITCIDSDDLISKDYIHILLNAAVKNDCDISIGKMVGLYTDNQEIDFLNSWRKKNSSVIIFNTYESLRIMLLQNEFDVSACAKLYKRELFNDVRYPVGKLYEDMATTYKLVSKVERVAYCKQAIYGYRQKRENSITSEKFNIRKMELMESYSKFYKFVKNNFPELSNEAECKYAACATKILTSLYQSNERKQHLEIEQKMKRAIRKRYVAIFRQKDLLLKRKIKIVCAGLWEVPYRIINKIYFLHLKKAKNYK